MRTSRSRALVAALALVALVPAVGHAVPADLVEDLEAAEADLAELDARVSLAVEEYNVATAQLDRVRAQHEATSTRVEALATQAQDLEARTAAYVRSMYMRGPANELTVALGTAEVTEAGRDLAVMTRLTRQRHAELGRLGATRTALDEARTQLTEQVRVAVAREEELADRRADVEALLSGQRDEVVALQERISLVQAEEAAQAERRAAQQASEAASAAARAASERAAAEQTAAEQAAAAQAAAEQAAADQAAAEAPPSPAPATSAATSPDPSLPPPPEPEAPPPGTRAGADRAVDAALSQVGKPYEYAASGPDSYDCSGLTLWAWRHAGVELPHSSRMQYAATTRVSRDQLQAGDLVFYGTPIHHVAMYLDGTRVVEAPYTGANVRIREDGLLRSDIVGYGRP